MESNRLAQWLTIGANLGVLIGILLLIAELKQNQDMMRAEIRHELSVGIVDLLQTAAGLTGVVLADGERRSAVDVASAARRADRPAAPRLTAAAAAQALPTGAVAAGGNTGRLVGRVVVTAAAAGA